jgi:hypothetical protein
MSYSAAAYAYDGTGSGISDNNGMLDIATRITQGMTCGMTMYEFQPVVSAYYDGVTYYPKQLITANSPWSGGYLLDTGFYMAMHFDKFIKTGWMYVEDACYGDGKAGGDGHAIVDSVFNYISCVDEDKKNCTIVLVNNTDSSVCYTISLQNLHLTEGIFHVWETKGPEEGQDYYADFFRNTGELDGSDGQLQVALAPYSMVTLSTLNVISHEYTEVKAEALNLPYADDFEYNEYAEDYLSSRGNAPRYTTDQGGAFEVASREGGNVLMQQITPSIKPIDWESTSAPVTNLGDDTWSNYTVSADVHFADEPEADGTLNYLGIGARYNLADAGTSGYWAALYENGTLELKKDSEVLTSAHISALDCSLWHNLKLTTAGVEITVSFDDVKMLQYVDSDFPVISGRIALYSGLQKNYFDNLRVTAVEGYPVFVTRMDNFDGGISYSEGSNKDLGTGWYHNTMCSFRHYHRTLSTGYAGAELKFSFEGTAFAVIGTAKEGDFTVKVDGALRDTRKGVNASGDRKAVYAVYGLEQGKHEVEMKVDAGTLSVDAVEFE